MGRVTEPDQGQPGARELLQQRIEGRKSLSQSARHRVLRGHAARQVEQGHHLVAGGGVLHHSLSPAHARRRECHARGRDHRQHPVGAPLEPQYRVGPCRGGRGRVQQALQGGEIALRPPVGEHQRRQQRHQEQEQQQHRRVVCGNGRHAVGNSPKTARRGRRGAGTPPAAAAPVPPAAARRGAARATRAPGYGSRPAPGSLFPGTPRPRRRVP